MGRTNPKNMRRASLSSKLLSWWSLLPHTQQPQQPPWQTKGYYSKWSLEILAFALVISTKGKRRSRQSEQQRTTSERSMGNCHKIQPAYSLSSIYVIFLDGRKMIKWKLELEVGFSVVFYFYSIAYIAFEPHSSWHGSITTTTSFFRKLFYSFFFYFCFFSSIHLDQN